MAHVNQLDPTKTALLVVDVQEAFRPVIPEFERLATRISVVVQGFQTLGLPVIVTEQYPKGLGQTVGEILTVLGNESEPIVKTSFSACGAADLVDRLEKIGVSKIVLCGLETHICVNQTAHDLLEIGSQVHVLSDCVASRSEDARRVGLAKMIRSGAIESTTEMALFELMRDAKHAKFKEIQALVK